MLEAASDDGSVERMAATLSGEWNTDGDSIDAG